MASSTSERTSLTVFGATGFTAGFVLRTIAGQLQDFLRLDPNFSWAIAGRSRAKLEALRERLGSDEGLSEKHLPSIVVADVKEQVTVKRMAEGTKLLLNCVGPYAFTGESVVKAVLSANEALAVASSEEPHVPVDYIDLAGEPAWMEEMVLRYHDRAARLNCSIVHAAAWDSVPSDLGVVFAKKQLLSKSVVPTSMEAFIRLRTSASKGMGIHYTTYEAAVNGFATRNNLRTIRRQLYAKLPRVKPLPVQRGLGSGIPQRPGKLGGSINWVEEQSAYVVPFFFADPAVVRLSQSLQAYIAGVQGGEDTSPVLSTFWFAVPSLSVLLMLLAALTVFGLLANVAAGRWLLLRYPTVFSAGMVSHEGPSQEQLEGSGFTTTIVARGYSAKALEDGEKEPDTRTVIRVNGPEIGYVSTPILFCAVARTMLGERDKVRNGVLTPAVALGETGVVEELNKGGRVVFSVVE